MFFALLFTTALALYSAKDAVIQATSTNFKSIVLDSPHVAIVEFFAPWCGHCKNLAPEFKKAGQKLKGLAKVVAVDCDVDANKAICGQYDVKDYNGARTAKGIVDFVIPQIPTFVQLVGPLKKAKSLESFLKQDVDTSNLQGPKAILFSEKKASSPLIKALSVEFKKRLIIGEVNAATTDKSDLSMFKDFEGIVDQNKLPALVVLETGETDVKKSIVYDGEKKIEQITKFLNKYALKKKAKSEKAEEKSESEKPEEPFDPVVHEIVSQKSLETQCTQKTGVCVIGVMTLEKEFEESVKAHKSELTVLEKKKFHEKKAPFNFVWVNPLRSPKPYFLSQFEVSDIYPGLVLVNVKKQVYTIFRGAFDEAGVSEFLEAALKGKGRYSKFEFTPQMVKAKDEL